MDEEEPSLGEENPTFEADIEELELDE